MPPVHTGVVGGAGRVKRWGAGRMRRRGFPGRGSLRLPCGRSMVRCTAPRAATATPSVLPPRRPRHVGHIRPFRPAASPTHISSPAEKHIHVQQAFTPRIRPKGRRRHGQAPGRSEKARQAGPRQRLVNRPARRGRRIRRRRPPLQRAPGRPVRPPDGPAFSPGPSFRSGAPGKQGRRLRGQPRPGTRTPPRPPDRGGTGGTAAPRCVHGGCRIRRTGPFRRRPLHHRPNGRRPAHARNPRPGGRHAGRAGRLRRRCRRGVPGPEALFGPHAGGKLRHRRTGRADGPGPRRRPPHLRGHELHAQARRSRRRGTPCGPPGPRRAARRAHRAGPRHAGHRPAGRVRGRTAPVHPGQRHPPRRARRGARPGGQPGDPAARTEHRRNPRLRGRLPRRPGP